MRLDAYQEEAVKFLLRARKAILADCMGAGKTAVALVAAAKSGAKRVLVVTKKSLIHHWRREAARWCGEDCGVFDGSAPDTRFVVAGYEMCTRYLDTLLAAGFDVVVVDEATAVKNRKARRSKAVHKLCWQADLAWLLTGTPITNRPDELWSLLHALDRKKFSSYWRFVGEFCVLEPSVWGYVKILGPKNLSRLREVVAPYILRRDAQALGLSLPELVEEDVYVEMTPRQRQLYREMRERFLAVVDEAEYVWAPNVVAQLVRLRQIAVSPVLVGDGDAGGKLHVLADFFEENLPYSKALLFTSFAQFARLAAQEFAGYNPVVITGESSNREREAAVDRFMGDDGCRLLVGTIRAMGEGLNLQAADIIVFADLDWSPAAMEQAVARARRRGREEPVRVVRLLSSGTVDEYIASVLERKGEMIREMDAVAFIVRRLKEEDGS